MTEREVYNEGRDGYANGLLVGANPYPNQCPGLRQLWGRGWYDRKHDVLTHFPCTSLDEDKTTQEIWDSLTARQYELERRLEIQNTHINILKGKVFGDNSWASIETLCDEGE